MADLKIQAEAITTLGINGNTVFRAVEDVSGVGTGYQSIKVTGSEIAAMVQDLYRIQNKETFTFIQQNTIDATPFAVCFDGSGTPGPTNVPQFNSENYRVSLKALISVSDLVTGDCGLYEITGVAKTDGIGVYTTSVIGNTLTTLAEETSLAGVNFQFVTSNTNNTYWLEITGIAANSVLFSVWLESYFMNSGL